MTPKQTWIHSFKYQVILITNESCLNHPPSWLMLYCECWLKRETTFLSVDPTWERENLEVGSVISSASDRLQQNSHSLTHHTSCLRLKGWSFCGHRGDKWPELPGNSVRCQGSRRPLHRRPTRPCPSHPLHPPAPPPGSRWCSTRWLQWWRLHLGPYVSPHTQD